MQTILIVVWMVVNTIPRHPALRPVHVQFLTLMLSLQAAYAAPLILLAQNRQDDRDRVNLEQDRDEARQSKADVEYLARELAAVRMALGEVVTRDFLRSELAAPRRRGNANPKNALRPRLRPDPVQTWTADDHSCTGSGRFRPAGAARR